MKKMTLVIAVFTHFMCWGKTDERCARDTFFPDAQWQPGLFISLSGGANIPLAGIKQGFLSDKLIGFQNQPLWWQPIDVHWQFSEKFGIGSVYRVMPVGNWEKRFTNDLEKLYPGYIIQTVPTTTSNLRSAKQVLMSLSVNHAWGKWFLQPHIQMGVTAFRRTAIGASAKENGTHQIYTLYLGYTNSIGTNNIAGFTMAAGAKTGRFIGKNWGVFGEINMYSFEKSISYSITTVDQIAGTTSINIHQYSRLTSGILVNVGVFRSVITW